MSAGTSVRERVWGIGYRTSLQRRARYDSSPDSSHKSLENSCAEMEWQNQQCDGWHKKGSGQIEERWEFWRKASFRPKVSPWKGLTTLKHNARSSPPSKMTLAHHRSAVFVDNQFCSICRIFADQDFVQIPSEIHWKKCCQLFSKISEWWSLPAPCRYFEKNSCSQRTHP